MFSQSAANIGGPHPSTHRSSESNAHSHSGGRGGEKQTTPRACSLLKDVNDRSTYKRTTTLF